MLLPRSSWANHTTAVPLMRGRLVCCSTHSLNPGFHSILPRDYTTPIECVVERATGLREASGVGSNTEATTATTKRTKHASRKRACSTPCTSRKAFLSVLEVGGHCPKCWPRRGCEMPLPSKAASVSERRLGEPKCEQQLAVLSYYYPTHPVPVSRGNQTENNFPGLSFYGVLPLSRLDGL